MAIDDEGLIIIDAMLDTAIELCLLPETWSEKELQMLNEIHKSVLRLNQYWIENHVPSAQFVHDIQPGFSTVLGYLDLLELTISSEKVSILEPYAKKLKAQLQLLRYKLEDIKSQLRTILD